jgi:acyl-CoA synthetase (AMP-forming)/AMP-acid ligase II
VIVNWSADQYKTFGKAKRGSVGLPRPGIELRIVDEADGHVLPAGQTGIIEAKVARVGPDWIHTTDLGSLDADGFLYIHGRADQAINRGGFKVLPETVAAALREHPAIADVAVLGLPDARLGEVPVAALETKGGPAPTDAELEAFARARLVAYQVPARYFVFDALPRTESMKVNLPDLRRLIDARLTAA